MHNDEYNDINYIINLDNKIQNELVKNELVKNESKELMKERTDSFRLTPEFNKKNHIRKSIVITNLSIMKDDIKNYRTLTDIQLSQLDALTETEKIEIIKLYNIMFASILELIN